MYALCSWFVYKAYCRPPLLQLVGAGLADVDVTMVEAAAVEEVEVWVVEHGIWVYVVMVVVMVVVGVTVAVVATYSIISLVRFYYICNMTTADM